MWARFGNGLDGTLEVRGLALGLVKVFLPVEQAMGRHGENGVLPRCSWSSCVPASSFLQ